MPVPVSDHASKPDGLTPEAYAALHEVAGALMRRERTDHTLQPTALVHEAFMRMRALERVPEARHDGPSRECAFRTLAAGTMRRILVDHARRHRADKRGGGRIQVDLPEVSVRAPEPLELLALDEALEALARLDERKARVVELRFFGGLSGHETAAVLGVAVSTADADWAFARAWLRKRLAEHAA
jgi:RNA polymerase sigma factor (TIGR02999 family)